ncbi:hypothetical protein [Oscillatoria acuminata]|uniref:Uncharacterized protein n=1 Tax=Oscillatoria acuminata PCC 6304 TaxID=56110 RepID=K9TRY4_9CYAN|nr:hypothetical protein [Oscillatoria acuminata]AFY85285.1 hypothetical protein Oscil6304_5816 [Oscillatoria acuminata PCC 6304]
MSEPTNQNTGSEGNQGHQANVAGVNKGIQNTNMITVNDASVNYGDHNTYNISGGRTPEQRKFDRDICRQMLEEQMQLTSNTVIGRV